MNDTCLSVSKQFSVRYTWIQVLLRYIIRNIVKKWEQRPLNLCEPVLLRMPCPDIQIEFWCMRVLMMYDHLDMCGHFSWLHLIMCLSTNLCIYNPLQGLNKQTSCHLILLSWLIYQFFFHNLHTRYESQLDWKLCKYICWYLNAWLAIINNTHDA